MLFLCSASLQCVKKLFRSTPNWKQTSKQSLNQNQRVLTELFSIETNKKKREKKDKIVTFPGVSPHVDNFRKILSFQDLETKGRKKSPAWNPVIQWGAYYFSWTTSHFGTEICVSFWGSSGEPMKLIWVVLLKSVAAHLISSPG